jgi:hypothetical protein
VHLGLRPMQLGPLRSNEGLHATALRAAREAQGVGLADTVAQNALRNVASPGTNMISHGTSSGGLRAHDEAAPF